MEETESADVFEKQRVSVPVCAWTGEEWEWEQTAVCSQE